LTLSEALETGLLEINKVSGGGFIPELKTINRGKSLFSCWMGKKLLERSRTGCLTRP